MRWRLHRADDRGFSLIEMLVAMVLTGVLGSLLIGSALGARKVTDDARANSELTADVRRAMERLVRELRQAGTIDEVDLPTTPSAPTAITFWADFDNDGARDVDASDPEVLTYRYIPGSGEITLTVDDADGNAVTTPILAQNVTSFTISLRSSQWQYDRNADGIVDWSELDAAASPVGNQNGKPDGAELTRIDSVVIAVSVYRNGRRQNYQTQVDFRNRHVT
jgi:prepilin-type N-terminal cleavage/methylation domain-containing protein